MIPLLYAISTHPFKNGTATPMARYQVTKAERSCSSRETLINSAFISRYFMRRAMIFCVLDLLITVLFNK